MAQTTEVLLHEKEELAGFEGAKFGMWLFLLTELLLFGGLFTAYTVFRALHTEAFHQAHLELNRTLGAVNTVILICSSFTMALAVATVQRGRQALSAFFLFLTAFQGGIFLVNKVAEYGQKLQHGLFPGSAHLMELPAGERLFFSLYYTMTGLHALHVLAGVIVLLWVFYRAYRREFSEKYFTPVEITGLYWHFVDLIWIYLFPLLYLIG